MKKIFLLILFITVNSCNKVPKPSSDSGKQICGFLEETINCIRKNDFKPGDQIVDPGKCLKNIKQAFPLTEKDPVLYEKQEKAKPLFNTLNLCAKDLKEDLEKNKNKSVTLSRFNQYIQCSISNINKIKAGFDCG